MANNIYEIDPLTDSRWPALLAGHASASVFHTPEWLAVLRRTYGYQAAVLTTSRPGNELTNGLVFCRVRSWLTGNRLVSLPFSDHCEPLVDTPETFVRLVSAYRALSDSEGCRYSELRPTSCLARYSSGFENVRGYVLHRLNLRPGAPELFRHFHQDCIRRKIKRAEREALQVVSGNTAAMVDRFYELVVRTRHRQRLPPQPIALFRNLAEAGSTSRIHLQFKDDVPIGGMLTLRFGKTLTYKYGASDERFHALGAMPQLFWRVIEDAVEEGFNELDFGRSDFKHVGLAAFKDHFAATRSTLCYWRAHSARPHPGWQRVADGLWSVVPDGALRFAGDMLYRHIG